MLPKINNHSVEAPNWGMCGGEVIHFFKSSSLAHPPQTKQTNCYWSQEGTTNVKQAEAEISSHGNLSQVSAPQISDLKCQTKLLLKSWESVYPTTLF